MSQVLNGILAANEHYAQAFGERANLPQAPARRIAILTCMDARLDPANFAGLQEGDAHVIRNAGGRASEDAIRSLVVSHKLLGTGEWLVIHHTDCGMRRITNELMGDLLAETLETARIGENGWVNTGITPGSDAGRQIDWLPIRDETGSIVDDVKRIRNHPLVPPYIVIYGYQYDVKTGRLIEIPEATEAGQAR